MPSYLPVIKNGANGAILYVGLIDQANTKLLKASPTIAAGDFQISKDGGAFANLGTLPTVTPAAGRSVKITLSQAEVNADNIVVQCVDAAGAEWCDLMLNIQTVARQFDDLAFPATSGRSIIVDANGLVDANMVKAGPTGSGTAQTARDIGGAVPAAAAGASGGLHINGSNSGTTTYAALTVTGALTISDGLLISRSTGNSSAITATGNGTGSGAVFTSGAGATGDGVQVTAASTNGNGLKLTKTGTGVALASPTTDIVLAKTVNITGFNDIAATAVVSAGAINTSGGAVSTVTTLTNLPAITANWLTAAGINAGALNGKGDWLLASSYVAPTNLTAAQIATGVWQDATAGDFTVASSVGKSLYTGNNPPGAASGLALVGSNMGAVTSVTGSVGSVTGAVGSVTGAVGSVTAAVTVGTINSGAVDSIWAKAMSALTAVPSITGTVLEALSWVFTVGRNKIEQTSTTSTLRRDDGTTSLSTSTVSDDGTTFTRGKWS